MKYCFCLSNLQFKKKNNTWNWKGCSERDTLIGQVGRACIDISFLEGKWLIHIKAVQSVHAYTLL